MLYLYSNVYSCPQNLLCYCFVQSQSVIEHLRALLCRMSSVYDVCLRMEYLSSVWDVSRVECLWRGIYSMWDVSHVGCLPCGMSSVWDVKELGGGAHFLPLLGGQYFCPVQAWGEYQSTLLRVHRFKC